MKIPRDKAAAFIKALERAKSVGLSNKELKSILGELVYPGDYINKKEKKNEKKKI